MSKAVRQPIFRNLLIILAILDMVLLGVRLWPWPAALGLGGDSTTALDPLFTLCLYVVLAMWIGSTRGEQERKSLFQAATLGAGAGALLVALVWVASQPVVDGGTQHHKIQALLIAGALAIWGTAAIRSRRSGHSHGSAVICATWSAMVSSLAGCTALLVETYYSMTPDQSADPWKQYQQGLAIGPESMQALVHTLNAAAGFLLVGPVVGCIAGAVLGATIKPRKA